MLKNLSEVRSYNAWWFGIGLASLPGLNVTGNRSTLGYGTGSVSPKRWANVAEPLAEYISGIVSPIENDYSINNNIVLNRCPNVNHFYMRRLIFYLFWRKELLLLLASCHNL